MVYCTVVASLQSRVKYRRFFAWGLKTLRMFHGSIRMLNELGYAEYVEHSMVNAEEQDIQLIRML